MPSYQIPHTARYIPTTAIFTATFNVPTVGKYDFGISANKNVLVENLLPGTIYLIDRLSIGGDINEGVFLDAIETLPELILRKSQTKEIVYKKPMPIVQYIDDQDIIAWIKTDKSKEDLTLDLTGVLKQTPSLVGVVDVKIFVSFSIYAIESSVFNFWFTNVLNNQTGMQVSGGIQSGI